MSVCMHCHTVAEDVRNRISDELLCDSCEKIREVELVKNQIFVAGLIAGERPPAAGTTTPVTVTETDVQDTNVVVPSDAVCCTAECTYSGKRDGRTAMVHCGMCMKDFHRKCLKIDPKDNASYACSMCRLFPAQIAGLLSAMIELKTDMVTLKQSNDEMNRKLNSTENKYSELIQINTDLRAAVGQITQTVSSQAWQSFRNAATPETNKTLLIGSSIIRDVDEDKLEHVEVRSYSGATVKEIHTEMHDINNKYEKVIIVAGGNDCDTNGNGRDISDVIVDYRGLITDCKKIAAEVSVATVCPRLKGPAVTERIDALNAGLQVLCSDENIAILDNEATFKLGNGAINDGYIMNKCKTHLTYAGTNALVKNLGLKPKPGFEDDICKRKPAHRGNQTNRQDASEKPAHQHHSSQGGYVHSGRGRYVRSNQGHSTGRHQDSTGSRPPRHTPGGGHSADRRRSDDDKNTNAPRRGDMRQHARRPGSPSRRHDNDTSSDWHTVNARSSRAPASSHSLRNPERPGNRNSCGFCGERNHRQDTCWHGKPVTCDNCKGPGHKSKHHNGH